MRVECAVAHLIKMTYWPVNIHQDVDEQYARRLRPGTRLALLDPALLISMFRQYQLGMCAAKFVLVNDLWPARDCEAYRDPDTWIGPPYWVCRRLESHTNVGKILTLKGWKPQNEYNIYTWTLGQYRAVAIKYLPSADRRNEMAYICWYDADQREISRQRLPFRSWYAASGGMTSIVVVDRLKYPALNTSYGLQYA